MKGVPDLADLDDVVHLACVFELPGMLPPEKGPGLLPGELEPDEDVGARVVEDVPLDGPFHLPFLEGQAEEARAERARDQAEGEYSGQKLRKETASACSRVRLSVHETMIVDAPGDVKSRRPFGRDQTTTLCPARRRSYCSLIHA